MPNDAAEMLVPDNAPWFQDRQGAKSGLAVDLVSLLAARSGLPLDVEGVPLARIASLLPVERSGRFAIFARPESLPDHLVQLGGTFEMPLLAIARDSEPPPTLDRLRQLGRVGLVHGAARLLPAEFVRGIAFEEMPDIPAGLKMLDVGRIDAMLLSKIEAELITEARKSQFHLGAAVQVETLHVALVASSSTAASAEAQTLEAAWNACLSDGSIERMLAARGRD